MQAKVNLDLTFQYKQGYSGVLVGQCVELPNLMVQARTQEELKDKMLKVLGSYFEKYPKEKERILARHGVVVDMKTWNKEKISCPV